MKKPRFIFWYETLLNSFWFVPTVMALLAAAAAVGSLMLDRSLGQSWWENVSWIWSSNAAGARNVLATVVGSTITVTSIVFSITVTALAQMSAQFGPRLLRNFTTDRGNQFTLGTFIATFIYCLLVLRTIRSDDAMSFVPHLSINVGVGLAIASLAVLIYFIHHVSQTIQAENLIAGVGRDFDQLLPVLYPEHIAHGEPGTDLDGVDLPTAADWDGAYPVTATEAGYVQGVEDSNVAVIARRHDLILLLKKRPGDFVTNSSLLLQAWPATHVDDQVEQQLRDCFSLGQHRTQHQDISYPVQQLVEIAARALSPGVNEPFTALTCIDWLGHMLRGVVARDLPLPLRYDENGDLRVITRPLQFEELANAAFEQIRIYGSTNPAVVVRLLDLIAGLAPHLCRGGDRQTLLHHTRLIAQEATQITNEGDSRRIEARLQATLAALASHQDLDESPQDGTECDVQASHSHAQITPEHDDQPNHQSPVARTDSKNRQQEPTVRTDGKKRSTR